MDNIDATIISQFCQSDLKNIVKSIEFISIIPEGLQMLFQHVKATVSVIAKCFNINKGPIQDIELLYPAATILLDLTANEQ